MLLLNVGVLLLCVIELLFQVSELVSCDFKLFLRLLETSLCLLEAAFHLFFSFFGLRVVECQLGDAFAFDDKLLAVFDEELHLPVVFFAILLHIEQLLAKLRALIESFVLRPLALLE